MRVVALLGLLLAAAANEPPPIAKAIGPWVVDFETTRCMASREFDVGGTSIVFGIEAVPTQPSRNIYFQRSGKLRTIVTESAKIFVGDKQIKWDALWGEPVVEKGNARYFASLSPEEYRSLLESGLLSVRSHNVVGRFPLSSLGALDEQLTKCTLLVLQTWGMNPADLSKITKFPKLKPSAKLKIASVGYPDAAQQRGAIGDVRVLVKVATSGKVLDCGVIRSSGHGDLDSNACAAMRSQAIFEPAQDRQGNAVPSLYMTDFRFMLFSFF